MAMVGSGEIVFLEEIEGGEEKYVGKSIRVVGSIEHFNIRNRMVLLSQSFPSKKEKAFLHIDTSSLDQSTSKTGGFRKGALFMFIGELKNQMLEGNEKNCASPTGSVLGKVLAARIGRNSDGLDLHLFRKAVLARRSFLAEESDI